MFSALPLIGDIDRRGRHRLMRPISPIYSRAERFPLCPGRSDINLFGYGEGIVDLDAEIPDGAFDFGVPQQELDSPQISRASINQRCLCSSQGMGAKDVWVQSDARSPFGDKPSVLPCRHSTFLTATAGKQDLAGLSSGGSEIVIYSLPGLLGQFEPDRLSGLLLAHCRAINDIAARGNIFDLQSDDIAAAQLAVDGEIEHRQITHLASNL